MARRMRCLERPGPDEDHVNAPAPRGQSRGRLHGHAWPFITRSPATRPTSGTSGAMPSARRKPAPSTPRTKALGVDAARQRDDALGGHELRRDVLAADRLASR